MAAKLPSENPSMCAPCRKSQWPSDVTVLHRVGNARLKRLNREEHSTERITSTHYTAIQRAQMMRGTPAWKPQRLGPGSRISRAMRSPVSPRAS